jgi:hypothetical protein
VTVVGEDAVVGDLEGGPEAGGDRLPGVEDLLPAHTQGAELDPVESPREVADGRVALAANGVENGTDLGRR